METIAVVVEEAVDTAMKVVVVMEAMAEDVNVDTMVVVDGGGYLSGGDGSGYNGGGYGGGSHGYCSGGGGGYGGDGGGYGGGDGGNYRNEGCGARHEGSYSGGVSGSTRLPSPHLMSTRLPSTHLMSTHLSSTHLHIHASFSCPQRTPIYHRNHGLILNISPNTSHISALKETTS
ncbi:hypothetical protein Bca4012_013154 [Brassica carinata]